jgi:hypothetical protein
LNFFSPVAMLSVETVAVFLVVCQNSLEAPAPILCGLSIVVAERAAKDERAVLLDNTRWNEMFPPDGVEIVDHYVMMGIGQVIVMRVPPERLRPLNTAIERGAWGAYQTEFYVTYDLVAARAAQAAAQ